MPRDARFWRNLAIIALAHLAVVLGLARAGRDSRSINPPSIVWMNSVATETAASNPPSLAAETETTPAPPASVPPPKAEEPAVPTEAKSEIQLPSPSPVATPTPAPKPKPSPTPSPVPKSSPKPTPKPTPKKSVAAKATPTPALKKKAVKKKSEQGEDGKKDEAKEALAKKSVGPDRAAEKSNTSGNGAGNGTGPASEFAWYGTMLHDRFRKEWEQPTTIVATGARMSTLVKIRIEKDGRVSKFTIVKPSGNVVVDESVAAVSQKVTQVDPLPAGLASKGYYEVNIDFELNAEK